MDLKRLLNFEEGSYNNEVVNTKVVNTNKVTTNTIKPDPKEEPKETPKTEQAPNTGHVTIFDKILSIFKK